MNSSANCEIEAGIDEYFTQRDDRTCYAFGLEWNEQLQCLEVTITRDGDWMTERGDPLRVPQETIEALGSLREVGRQIAALALARSEASSNTKTPHRGRSVPSLSADTVRIGPV